MGEAALLGDAAGPAWAGNPNKGEADLIGGAAGPAWAGSQGHGEPDLLGGLVVDRERRRRDPHRRSSSTPPPSATRRLAVTAVGVLVAAAALVTLRAGTEPVDRTEAAPSTPIATPNIYARAYVQEPPFDRLPGRTPIPDPEISFDRHTVQGPLPAVGDRTPGPVTARLAAGLVLGRYCRRPASLDLLVRPLTGGWTRVRIRALRDGTHPVAVDIRLTWDAGARGYAWNSAVTQLESCS